MTFGDPAAVADVDAAGVTGGGPWWLYLLMWLVIGLLVVAIPAVLLVPSLTSGTRQSSAFGRAQQIAGLTSDFDGTYLSVESRLNADQHLIGGCDSNSADRPGQLTIVREWARYPPLFGTEQSEVSVKGLISLQRGASLLSVRVDRQGSAEGDFFTRYCTYHLTWKKE